MTRLLDGRDESALKMAAHLLSDGKLVALPTETVYGLGADALSPTAVNRIFQVKGRPSTDPLIVHIAAQHQARELLHPKQTTSWQREVLQCLSTQFWPGPLTLILPANPDKIATQVTSGTGWVGIRHPAHPIAQRILQLCDLPVAAPSANLFGHVSPTTAEHVYNDFPDVDNLWIVDGGRCGFGIESTVVRINQDETLDVFRRGGVGLFELRDALLRDRLIQQPTGAMTQASQIHVVEKYSSAASLEAHVAPGQLIVHYAPRILTLMVSRVEVATSDFITVSEDVRRDLVVLDFGGALSFLRTEVGFYRDLSLQGNAREAAYALFDALRWAETSVSVAGQLWIFDPASVERREDEIFHALKDRIVRSASGRKGRVAITQDSDRVCVLIR